MVEHLIAFSAVFALDVLYTLYTRRVTQGHALGASLYAGVLYGVTGLATITVVKTPSVLPAAILGAVLGTWVSVKWDSRQQPLPS